jgi:hypothetical protein
MAPAKVSSYHGLRILTNAITLKIMAACSSKTSLPTYNVKTRRPQSVTFFPRKPDNFEGLMAGGSLYLLFLQYLSTAFVITVNFMMFSNWL